MAGDKPSTEETPSAGELKDRLAKLHDETKLGAGDKEPDPATAENPPQDRKEGDTDRDPD